MNQSIPFDEWITDGPEHASNTLDIGEDPVLQQRLMAELHPHAIAVSRPIDGAYNAPSSTGETEMLYARHRPSQWQQTVPFTASVGGRSYHPSNNHGYNRAAAAYTASRVIPLPGMYPTRQLLPQTQHHNSHDASISQVVARPRSSPPSPAAVGEYSASLSPVRGENAAHRRRRNQPRRSSSKEEKFQCEDCLVLGKKNYYIHGPATGGTRCRKHHTKWLKEQASTKAPTYVYDMGITSFEDARNYVYPMVQPLEYDGNTEDDFGDSPLQENGWVMKFIDAANAEYTAAEMDGHEMDVDQKREHEHLLKQQDTYNHKPHEKSSKDSYTNHFINIRMRFLYRAVRTFHRGGPAVYPVGGANGGYGEDNKLTMTERLEAIEAILREEKRVVMDVVEGRGVLALAANPGMYKDRKASNNKCNTKKKGKFQLADKIEAKRAQRLAGGELDSDNGDEESELEEEEEVTPAPVAIRGRKRKAQEPSRRSVRGGRGRGGKRRSMAREQENDSDVVETATPTGPSSAGVQGGSSTGDCVEVDAEAGAIATPSNSMEYRAPVTDMVEPTLHQQHIHAQHHVDIYGAPATNLTWQDDPSGRTTADPTPDAHYGSSLMLSEPSSLEGMADWDPSKGDMDALMDDIQENYMGDFGSSGLDPF